MDTRDDCDRLVVVAARQLDDLIELAQCALVAARSGSICPPLEDSLRAAVAGIRVSAVLEPA